MTNNNNDEKVAWVDENEKLIKVIPRTLANSDPKYLHSEIAVIIYDERRRVLLQQRSKSKKVNPSVWAVIAGHVTYGDSLDETVRKEVKEEMGIAIPTFTYTYREYVKMPNETHYCHWYLGKYEGGEINIDPIEVDDYAWVSEDALEEFRTTHNVAARTVKELQDFWLGKWDKLLQ
jgi:isopentenyldiphosphate isomerase